MCSVDVDLNCEEGTSPAFRGQAARIELTRRMGTRLVDLICAGWGCGCADLSVSCISCN